jgi:hypothetical protein
MDAHLQHRIRRVGFELAHSSMGWLSAGYALVIMVALTAGFRTPARWVATHFWVLMPMTVASLAVGIVAHYFYQRWSRSLLHQVGVLRWRDRLVQHRSYTHEATVGLSILLLVGVGYSAAMFAAARASNRIVSECSAQFTAQLEADGAVDATALSRSSCECLGKIFFERNGVFRMALFDTRLLGKEDFAQVDEIDEALCMNAAFDAYPLAKRLATVPVFDSFSTKPNDTQTGQ